MNNFVFTIFVVAAIMMISYLHFSGRENSGHVKKRPRLAQRNRRAKRIKKTKFVFFSKHTHTSAIDELVARREINNEQRQDEQQQIEKRQVQKSGHEMMAAGRCVRVLQ